MIINGKGCWRIGHMKNMNRISVSSVNSRISLALKKTCITSPLHLIQHR